MPAVPPATTNASDAPIIDASSVDAESVDTEAVDTAQDWPIETELFRLRVSRQPDNGRYRCARPERKVARQEWASMYRPESPWVNLSEDEVLALADEMHAEAARRYQLGRQQRAVQKQNDLDQARRRRRARTQLHHRMRFRWPHLREAYREEKPMRYAGGPDGESKPMAFLEWLPRQLDAEGSQELGKMKRQVKDAYDLPSYVQLT